MTTAIARLEPAPVSPPVVTPEQHELIRRTVAKDATDDELRLYLYDCARQGVHPLDKLLHFTKRGGKYTPVTSIDLMRMRAADTGEYVGNEAYVFTGTPGQRDFTATAQVWRLVQGQRVPFARTVHWTEFCPTPPGDHMYRKMPHVMLGKCAEAQALRAGFPRQLHGLYIDEEMAQAPEAATPPPPAPAARPPAKAALITSAQRKQLFDKAKAFGWSQDAVKTWLKGRGHDSTLTITQAQFPELLAGLEQTAGATPAEEEFDSGPVPPAVD